MDSPKVLVVIVAHPFRKIAGATNAGLALTRATAQLMDLDLAVMWDADETVQEGRLRIRRVRCTTPAGWLSALLPRPLRIAFATSDIPRLIETGGYDLVHVHNLFPLYAAEQIAEACARSNTPMVVSTHGFFELSTYGSIRQFGALKAMAARWLVETPFRRILSKVSAFFCLSPADTGLLVRLGVADTPVRIVTNGVSEYYLDAPSQGEIDHVRARFGLAPHRPMLLFMGSLHSYKGVDVFLQSLSLLDVDCHAVIAGSFKHANEPTALMDAVGVSDEVRRRVTFTGAVSDAELRALYGLADVFVYPTRGDTLPLVVLEAMACGAPIVSTTIGGIPFEVTAECGMLTAPDDPAGTAEAVRTLLHDPARRQAMGAAGRARVRSTFRWSAAALAARDGYRSVLGHVAIEAGAEVEMAPVPVLRGERV